METLNAELFKIEYPNRAIVRDKSFANDAGYRIDEKTDDYWMNNVIGDAGRSTSWIVYLRFENNVTFEDHDLVDLLVDDLLIAGKTITFFENWYHVTFDPTDDPENEGELLSAFRFIKAIRDAVHPISVEKAGVVQKKHIRLQGSAKLKDADIDSIKLDSIHQIGEMIDGFEVVSVFFSDDSDSDIFPYASYYGLLLVNFHEIELCNYARAKEIADSLSAELMPIRKYPHILSYIYDRIGYSASEELWGDSETEDEASVYYANDDTIEEAFILKTQERRAIPCRILVKDRYVTNLYSRTNEVEISLASDNVNSQREVGVIERIKLTLKRKSDNVIISSIEHTVKFDDTISISYTELVPSPVRIEYIVRCVLYRKLTNPLTHRVWVDSVSFVGGVGIISENDFELILNKL